MTSNDSSENLRNRLAEKMAGDITLSEKPGESLKKWRLNFEISQTDIANYLKVSPSVISDYESGRRKSPGTMIVRKIVESLLEVDIERGGKKIHTYESILNAESGSKSIYSTYEYTIPIQLAKLVNLIEGEIVYKGAETFIWFFCHRQSTSSPGTFLPRISEALRLEYGQSHDLYESQYREIPHGGYPGHQPETRGCCASRAP